jgi:hypothetical protein
LHLEGKASYMTLSRIQELESLGFEWDSRGASCVHKASAKVNLKQGAESQLETEPPNAHD